MMIGLNAVDTLMRLSGAQSVSRALHVVADLGIPDALGETPQTGSELALATGMHAGALERVLLLLAEYGIFERRNGTFAHTPASRLLRSDHPQSMRSFVRMMGFPIYWRMWEAFGYSVRTGAATAERVIPGGSWRYLADHPEEGRIFDEAMTAKSQAQIPAILRAYDFSRFRRIGDIGGGHGHLLRAVLNENRDAGGVLFDLPHVIEHAALTRFDRLTFEAGSFFADPLPVCDCYLLMHVLHDWNDDEAVKILRTIRRVSPPEARVLIVETVIPEATNPSWERILDMHMLALHAGKERTRAEYGDLFRAAGFRLEHQIDTQAGVWILDGHPSEAD